MHSLPETEDEMCRRRTRSSLQAMRGWESSVYFRGVQPRKALHEVRIRFIDMYSNSSSYSSTNIKKHEQLTRSLRKMEKTLDTVLRSIGNPSLSSIVSGMVSRSPSPSNETATKTQALLESPSPPPPSSIHAVHRHQSSPRLHSLPDNDLNPLGLLAEASLANRRAQLQSPSLTKSETYAPNVPRKIGVASDSYFKPGTSSHR